MNELNQTALTLLAYSKRQYLKQPCGRHNEIYDRVCQVLQPLYGTHLCYKDLLSICVKTYLTLLNENRFELGGDKDNKILELLLSPVDSHVKVSKELFVHWDDSYNITDIYASVIKHILCQLSIARVDWCTEFQDLMKSKDAQNVAV